ncbi:MAG TPA: hypothetical protein VGM42_09915 [Rhodopila sp.]
MVTVADPAFVFGTVEALQLPASPQLVEAAPVQSWARAAGAIATSAAESNSPWRSDPPALPARTTGPAHPPVKSP